MVIAAIIIACIAIPVVILLLIARSADDGEYEGWKSGDEGR